jgi:hypothetical protein
VKTHAFSQACDRWRVHRHPEVVKYLIGLRERGMTIRWVISQLATNSLSSEAKPHPVSTRNKLNHWLWIDERHWITCRVDEEEHAIYVTNVEPVSDDTPS